MHIIIFITIIMHFRQGKKITLGLMEVVQKLSVLQSLDDNIKQDVAINNEAWEYRITVINQSTFL